MEKLTFKLTVFEGPLDLMLHLISKHKLNIYDIEISLLLEQYLDYIESMKAADLEVASEFLIMAARLVYIKTVSLLPVHDDEGDELKKELEGQLLEYSLIKQMAKELANLDKSGQIFVRDPQKIDIDKTYTGHHEDNELLNAYLLAISKVKRRLPVQKTAFSGIVSRRIVSVESRIVFVLQKLYKNEKISYDEFFYSSDKSEMVATFLAMLELIKSQRITVSDDNKYVFFNKNYIPDKEVDENGD